MSRDTLRKFRRIGITLLNAEQHAHDRLSPGRMAVLEHAKRAKPDYCVMAQQGRDETMKTTGITTDGKMVVDGIFEMYDTHGLPLSDCFALCAKHDIIPDWIVFVKTALAHHWNPERIVRSVREAFQDSEGWSSEWKATVLKRLEGILGAEEVV